MPRRLRVQYPGAIYHVISRGDHQEPIFLNDTDRHDFLCTLGKACGKTGWLVHAYSLIPNHFHLILETPRANLVDGMRWLLGTYTIRLNRRHSLAGHLFAGRYKAKPVQGTGDGYFRTACLYVHLNPACAGLLRPEEPLQSFVWSSYRFYLERPTKRPPWLCTLKLLQELGIPRDTQAGRKEFARITEQYRQLAQNHDFDAFQKGWCHGDEQFRKELLTFVSENATENHYGPECQESDEQKADQIVVKELKRRGWKETDLQTRPKGDGDKVIIAKRLREETTMTLRWIARRLGMGHWTYAWRCLRAADSLAGK